MSSDDEDVQHCREKFVSERTSPKRHEPYRPSRSHREEERRRHRRSRESEKGRSREAEKGRSRETEKGRSRETEKRRFDVFGPALPPHLLKKTHSESAFSKESKCKASSSSKAADAYGPELPRSLSRKKSIHKSSSSNGIPKQSAIVPEAPQHLLKPQQPDNEDETSHRAAGEEEKEDKSYGPRLPPSTKVPSVIGPRIPSHLSVSQKSESEDEEEEKEKKTDQVSDGEDTFGPSPALMTTGPVVNYPALSRRKKSAPEESKEGPGQRETWMLELPPEKAANFGLGPRQFRTKLGPDKDCDRSTWTDTPEDKERKSKQPPVKDDSKTVKQLGIEERDKEMERLARKAEKKLKRKESLLEIHAKKQKKKAKKEAKKREKEGKPVERRPFDRNVDLQVNRFDESQKKAILKKAQLLNDRFSQGESKFL